MIGSFLQMVSPQDFGLAVEENQRIKVGGEGE